MSVPTSDEVFKHLAASFDGFRYFNSLLQAIFSTYCFFFFGNQMIWRWLLFNTWCSFIAFETWTTFEAYGWPEEAGKGIVPFCVLFWSLNEIGDIFLFYYRYLIVKTEPVEMWFRFAFFVPLGGGILTRFIQFCLHALHGGWDLPEPGSQYLEPIYFLFLLTCEVLLQVRYLLAVRSMGGIGGNAMLKIFLRSAGARMFAVTAPLLVRMAAQFSASKSPIVTIAVNFHTAVNMFTLLDLLLMKIELKEASGSKVAAQSKLISSNQQGTATRTVIDSRN